MVTAIPAASDKNGTGGMLDTSLRVVSTIVVTSNEMSTISEPDTERVSDAAFCLDSCREGVEEVWEEGRVLAVLAALGMVNYLVRRERGYGQR